MMNERIQELKKQASAYASTKSKEAEEWRWIYEEKFAELIIRECRDIVEQDMKLAHIQMIPLTLEKYANGRLKEKIREHFGVEK